MCACVCVHARARRRVIHSMRAASLCTTAPVSAKPCKVYESPAKSEGWWRPSPRQTDPSPAPSPPWRTNPRPSGGYVRRAAHRVSRTFWSVFFFLVRPNTSGTFARLAKTTVCLSRPELLDFPLPEMFTDDDGVLRSDFRSRASTVPQVPGPILMDPNWEMTSNGRLAPWILVTENTETWSRENLFGFCAVGKCLWNKPWASIICPIKTAFSMFYYITRD